MLWAILKTLLFSMFMTATALIQVAEKQAQPIYSIAQHTMVKTVAWQI